METNPDKYFADVPAEDRQVLREFRNTHPLKQIDVNGIPLRYYCSGEGETGLLIFHGAAVNAEFLYKRILDFEKHFKVIAPNIGGFKTMDDFSRAIGKALEQEGIRRLVVMGGSMGGMIAQAYFKRNAEKIDKLILTITMAAHPERNKKWGLFIIKALPFGLLRPLFKKKLAKLFEVEIPPEAEGKVRMLHAHFTETLDTKTTKKNLLSQLKLVFEWNAEAPPGAEDISRWPCKTLLISCEDDPGYKDFPELLERFPNVTSHVFPKGAGHMVPLVHEAEYLKIIRDFLNI
jgi:pimeloyl-ACP methyl ester carboxylesterase